LRAGVKFFGFSVFGGLIVFGFAGLMLSPSYVLLCCFLVFIIIFFPPGFSVFECLNVLRFWVFDFYGEVEFLGGLFVLGWSSCFKVVRFCFWRAGVEFLCFRFLVALWFSGSRV